MKDCWIEESGWPYVAELSAVWENLSDAQRARTEAVGRVLPFALLFEFCTEEDGGTGAFALYFAQGGEFVLDRDGSLTYVVRHAEVDEQSFSEFLQSEQVSEDIVKLCSSLPLPSFSTSSFVKAFLCCADASWTVAVHEGHG